MTTDYKIDIFQNEIKSFKGLKIFTTIFIIFFLGTGLFYIIQAYHKDSSWTTYLTALTPIGMAVIIYFQSTGKWIYKRFLIINSNAIKWTRSKLFGTTLLYWSDVDKIQFEYSSIKFELKNGRKKNFTLTNISMQQITELKSLIQEICVSKSINYHSV